MRKISYRISSNLGNKWGKHGRKFIYAMRKIMAFTAPIFMELIVT